jgi:hypothetical protein
LFPACRNPMATGDWHIDKCNALGSKYIFADTNDDTPLAVPSHWNI